MQTRDLKTHQDNCYRDITTTILQTFTFQPLDHRKQRMILQTIGNNFVSLLGFVRRGNLVKFAIITRES